jgi:integrase
MSIRPLKLGGLSKDAVAQMLHELSKRQVPETLVSLIFEESQGYPFFIEEVYRHLIEEGKVFDEAGQFRTDIEIGESEVPENVRLIVGRRLERLDENVKRALTAAAVIGRSFCFKLLTAICQIELDELFTIVEKAQQMGIIVASSEGLARPFIFTHEPVRQTLLAGISAPRRQHLHAGACPTTTKAARRRSAMPRPASFSTPRPAIPSRASRDRAILATLLYHGIRREELCGLRVKDMQSRQGVLHFRVKGKRGKVRFVPVQALAQRLIEEYLALAGHAADTSGPVFVR